MVETVRETIERVMREQGNFNNPLTINTPIGSRTFYERDMSEMIRLWCKNLSSLKPRSQHHNIISVMIKIMLGICQNRICNLVGAINCNLHGTRLNLWRIILLPEQKRL